MTSSSEEYEKEYEIGLTVREWNIVCNMILRAAEMGMYTHDEVAHLRSIGAKIQFAGELRKELG